MRILLNRGPCIGYWIDKEQGILLKDVVALLVAKTYQAKSLAVLKDNSHINLRTKTKTVLKRIAKTGATE